MKRTILAFLAGLSVIPLLMVIRLGWHAFTWPGARAAWYFHHRDCSKAVPILEELLRQAYLSAEDRQLYSDAWEACYMKLHPRDPAARKPVTP